MLHRVTPMDEYCVIEDGGIAHVLSDMALGRRCACGRKVLTRTDDGGIILRNAPTSERLSSLVLLMAAARKTGATRTLWESRLFS